jgi:hypothetical protein
MIELLLPYGFDTLEYSWVKATISICTLADYSVAKKRQQLSMYLFCYSRIHVITLYSGYVCDVLCIIASVMTTHNDPGYD